MSRPISKQSDSEWAKAFSDAVAATSKRPQGPGWKTRSELLDMFPGMGEYVMRNHIRTLIKLGRMERFLGSARTEAGKLNNMTWYRLKK